jgi:hypothetical protein
MIMEEVQKIKSRNDRKKVCRQEDIKFTKQDQKFFSLNNNLTASVVNHYPLIGTSLREKLMISNPFCPRRK